VPVIRDISEDFRESMSDSDIIIRMLYFCEVPKLPSQIMNYCMIDGVRFKRFSAHCIKRGLLKIVANEDGLFALQITERGREVLSSADSIMEELGIGQDEPLR
jgi:predicted transcriptional regulator